MTISDKSPTVLGRAAFDMLVELQKLTKVGGDKVTAAMEAIGAGIDAILDANADDTPISLAKLEAEIEKLRGENGLAGNDATLDAEADAKFGRKPDKP